jgi:FlgD Ig-like domain
MARSFLILAVLLLLAPLQSLAQCPDLDVLDDGTEFHPLPALVISEVNPGDYIELFNTTGSDIVLPNIYWLCSDLLYAQVAGTVPAGGYATVAWPANFTRANNTSGEMMIYDNFDFLLDEDIMDYVIWGSPTFNRKGQAIAVGKWVGENLTALTNGAVHRKIGVTGTSAADYDNTSAPSAMNCTPPTTGVGDTPALSGVRVWNSPNPFKTDTQVEFMLDASAEVEVAIYSVTGALVRILSKQSYPAGHSRVAWDGTDQSGRAVASGTYLARLSGGVSAAARVTLIR